MLKKTLVGVACAAAVVGIGAGTAAGGEITGPPGSGHSLQIAPHELHGASVCAFSGLNDAYSGDPDVPDEDGFTRTQSWGQLSQEARAENAAAGFHPGDACRPGGGAEG